MAPPASAPAKASSRFSLAPNVCWRNARRSSGDASRELPPCLPRAGLVLKMLLLLAILPTFDKEAHHWRRVALVATVSHGTQTTSAHTRLNATTREHTPTQSVAQLFPTQSVAQLFCWGVEGTSVAQW